MDIDAVIEKAMRHAIRQMSLVFMSLVVGFYAGKEGLTNEQFFTNMKEYIREVVNALD